VKDKNKKKYNDFGWDYKNINWEQGLFFLVIYFPMLLGLVYMGPDSLGSFTLYILSLMVTLSLLACRDIFFGFPLRAVRKEDLKPNSWISLRSRIFLRYIQFLQKQTIPTLYKHISQFFPNFDTDLYSDEFLEKYKGIVHEPNVFSPKDRRAILFYTPIFLIFVLLIVFYPFKYLLILIALPFQWIYSFLDKYGYNLLIAVLTIILLIPYIHYQYVKLMERFAVRQSEYYERKVFYEKATKGVGFDKTLTPTEYKYDLWVDRYSKYSFLKQRYDYYMFYLRPVIFILIMLLLLV